MADEKIDIKKLLGSITDEVTSTTLDWLTRFHIDVYTDIVKYAWSDFLLSEDEMNILNMIQKRFEISDEDRAAIELSVLNSLHKEAAEKKDYEGGYRIYSRILELDPDNEKAKKGLEICKKHMKKGDREKVKEKVKKEGEKGEKRKKEAEIIDKDKVLEVEEKVPTEQQPQQIPQVNPVCPTCQGPLTWIVQYGRWYCYKCQKYA